MSTHDSHPLDRRVKQPAKSSANGHTVGRVTIRKTGKVTVGRGKGRKTILVSALPEPTVPSSPLDSRLLRAIVVYLDSLIAHPNTSAPIDDFYSMLDGELDMETLGAAERIVLAAVESTVMEQRARDRGHLSAAARYLPESVDEEIRTLLTSASGIDKIIGWFEVTSRKKVLFHRGLAKLSEQETRCMEMMLAGFEEKEIATYLDRKRFTRFGRAGMIVSTQQVHGHLTRGLLKLKRVFHAG